MRARLLSDYGFCTSLETDRLASFPDDPDVTHPGTWMAHCHIAEHHESGMIFSFEVAPAAGA